MGFLPNIWTFFLVLTSCYVLPLQTQLVNISATNDDVCKIFFKDRQNKKSINSDGFWSITTVFHQRLTDNRDGRLYIGKEAAIFRFLLPGLYSSNLETISFQLYGHPQVFVRHRADGGVYLDRSNASLEFNMSASFKVLKSNHPDFFYLRSTVSPGLNISLNNNSSELSMSRSGSEFQLVFPDNIESFEVDTGFTQRSWAVTTSLFSLDGPDSEILFSSPPNDTTTVTNILPYTLNTSPNTSYRIQGYWRPYFNGWYNFSVNCDLQYELIVEQDDRTVKFCNVTEICEPVFLRGGPRYAYYYVEIQLYSGNTSGVFNIDVFDETLQQLKFAEFKKIDRDKATHHWKFDNQCNTSCWDELKLSSLDMHSNDKLIAGRLILYPENFMPESEAGFSVGFWFSKRKPEKRVILSYGTDFGIWLQNSTPNVTTNLTNLGFRVGDTLYNLSTLEQVFHVVFTLSDTNVTRCYINGKHVNCASNPVTDFPPRERKLFVTNPVNKYFSISELFLWSSEMTPEQVVNVYQVPCKVYQSSCRLKNIHSYPDQWLLWSGPTPSYPFTGPQTSRGHYYYIEGTLMDYNSSAILHSPKFLSVYECLRFQYYMYGMGIGKLSVYAEYESHTDALWSLHGAQQTNNSNWKTASVSIPSLDKSAWRTIAFRAVRGENFRSDIAINYIQLQVEGCETTPQRAVPGVLNNNVNSCPSSCPNGYPCIKSIKGTDTCVCDTRQANFVNQSCMDDINSLYIGALYYWSMDTSITDTFGKPINASFVTGVANKAMTEFGWRTLTTFSALKEFSVSMWVNIAEEGFLFRIPRLNVSYETNTGLELYITPYNKSCSYLLQYKWPMNIFLHIAIVSQDTEPYLKLYKNGNLHTRYNFTESKCSGEVGNLVDVFSGKIYDDFAIWSKRLSISDIFWIFERYSKYKTPNGTYKQQPVIFSIDGWWTDNVKNTTDKDGLVHEEIQHKIYNELDSSVRMIQDIATTDSNLISSITIFMSYSDYWRQLFIRTHLIKKTQFANIIMDYNVTSKYVSDKAPSNLIVPGITATSLNLSWQFAFEEKLSPFQGFSVFCRRFWPYSLKETFYETTTTRAEIVGLKPFTEYEVRVAPWHLIGLGFISDGITVKTREWVPAAPPRHFQVKVLSSTSLEIQWGTVPDHARNGIIIAYEIAILDELKNCSEYVNQSASVYHYVKNGLRIYHPYSVKIAAMTSVGRGVWSPWARKRTSGDAPSAPPRNFTGMVRDHQSITFTWHEVPRDDWNSPSIEYLLNCCDNGITCKHRNEYLIRCCNVTEVTCLKRKISGGHTNFTLNGLKPFTLYNCSILAFNSQGQGPSAWVELVTTKQAYSKSFLNVTRVSVATWSISLHWNYSRPAGQDSHLHLQYSCSSCATDDSVHLDITNRNNMIIDNLMANQRYYIYVYELYDGDIVENCSVTFKLKTAEDVPPAPQNVTLWPLSSTSLSLEWSKPPDNPGSGSILGYNVVLLDLVTGTSHNFTNYTEKYALLNDLKEYHIYSVKVAAFTAVGQGMFTPWIRTRTLEDVPSGAPVNLTVTETSTSSLVVTWTPILKEDRNGVILGYVLTILDHLTSQNETVILNGSDQFMYGKNDIKKYYSYLITIAGRTFVGVGSEESSVEISNLGKVPPPPPQNISVTATSSTTLRVTWSVVMLQHFHDVLQYYEIRLKDLFENTTQYFSPQFNTTQFVFEMDGLKKYYKYVVSMAVLSTGGASEFSPWIGVTTSEDTPCFAPRHLFLKLSQTLTYSLEWLPLNSTGWCGEPRGYRVSYGLQNMSTVIYTTVNVSHITNQFWLAKNLTRFVDYKAYVAAFTTVGVGPSVWRRFYLNDVPTSSPVIQSIETINSTTLKLQWSCIPNKHGVAGGYAIRVQCLACRGIFAEPKTFYISARSHHAILSGLRIYSNYSAEIAAYNEFGEGNFGDPVFARTDESAPKAAPKNVSSFSTDPNNLTVFWSGLNNTWGEITYYRVHLYTTSRKMDVLTTENNYLTFTGLNKSTVYKFEVQGATSKGEGPLSVQTSGQTLFGDPQVCLSNISLFDVTSKSVEITWQALNSDLVPGGLASYEILYRIDDVRFSRDVHVTDTRSTHTAFRLGGLEESVTYWISVRASIDASVRNYEIPQCPEYNVTTKDDVPDAPPLEVFEGLVTSTSVTVRWKAIPFAHMNGILLGYRLNYSMTTRSPSSRIKKDISRNDNQVYSVTVGPDKNSYIIESLKMFTIYSVTIAGYNEQGVGPFSQFVNILTAEDVPSRAPTNLRVVNRTSSTSLQLSWDPVPQDYIHGILTGYTVRYQAIEEGAGVKITESRFSTLYVPAHVNSVEIRNLASYTRYKLTMFAKTKVGNGVFSKDVVGDTCRCHVNMSTNWWKIKPYIDLTEDSNLTGVFPVVLHDMVTSCCQSCGTHRTTKIEFLTEGSVRNSLEDVRNGISESDLSFPVYGSSDQETHGALYGYVPVINSPGEAYVVNREPDKTSTDILVTMILSCWPLVILSLVFSILAGFVIWFLEFRSNPEQFPPRFVLGLYHGIWWAFVTASTVGYGDRRPKTVGGKIFSVVWTLTGQVVILILTSLIAGHLTTYSLKIDRSLYGKQIAAILNSPQYNFAIRRNAKVGQTVCYNVEDMVSALKDRKVDGLVVDTYVAGARKELFSEYFRVRKIFDHKSAYGMVLAGDAMKLQTCFTKFLKENRAMVFAELRKVVDAIEEPKLSESLTRSTKLFDPTSSHTYKSMLYCTVILCVLVLASLLYEGNRRRKRKNKVEPYRLCEAMKKLREDTNCEIRQFSSKLNCLCLRIRRKHKQELYTLNLMKKSYLSGQGHRNWTELTEIDKNKSVSL